MTLASISQDDFGGGISRGRKAPAIAVYDVVNGLVDDEGLIFRRGGTAYYPATDAAVTLQRIVTANLPGPVAVRVVAWGTKMYVFDSVTPREIFDAGSLVLGRPVSVGGVLVWPAPQGSALGSSFSQILVYGGSLLTTNVANVGTITVTHGSTAVTKAGGASWVGAADAGMIVTAGGAYGLVRSIDGANALTLVYPWSGATTSTGTYTLDPSQSRIVGSALPTGIPATDKVFLGAAGQRLLVGIGNRVYVADRSTAGPIFAFDPDIYHELPAATEVTGIEGVGDSAFVFTTVGVYVISNLSLDVVDAYGNIQQSVQRISGDIVLWGEHGVASWAGGTVVPALDDVYVLSADGQTATLSGGQDGEKIRRLYRSYTKTAGYQPGGATVTRGHLFLPIVNGSTVVDVLVCRLDRGAVWTRWSGHAAGTAYAVQPGSASVAPQALSVNGLRVTQVTGCFAPTSSNALDADGTTSDCVITTRDFPTGQQPGFFKTARARYELTDDGSGATAAPTVAVAFTSDADAGSFTTLTDKGQQGGGTGWGVSDGSKYQWASVGKKRERGRLRITVTGACSSFVLRSVELLLRSSGKQ